MERCIHRLSFVLIEIVVGQALSLFAVLDFRPCDPWGASPFTAQGIVRVNRKIKAVAKTSVPILVFGSRRSGPIFTRTCSGTITYWAEDLVTLLLSCSIGNCDHRPN